MANAFGIWRLDASRACISGIGLCFFLAYGTVDGLSLMFFGFMILLSLLCLTT